MNPGAANAAAIFLGLHACMLIRRCLLDAHSQIAHICKQLDEWQNSAACSIHITMSDRSYTKRAAHNRNKHSTVHMTHPVIGCACDRSRQKMSSILCSHKQHIKHSTAQMHKSLIDGTSQQHTLCSHKQHI